MSLRHALYVLNDERFRTLPPTARHVLTVLAVCASDNGNVCWPGEDWLVRSTGLSRASIYRAKPLLREFVEIDPPGYKRTNSYYFPPVDVHGKQLSEVAKVLEAKRVAMGETNVDNPTINVDNTSHSETQSQVETQEGALRSLIVRRLPSQGETGGGLTVRREVKDESKKKSEGLIPSHGETSHSETSVDNYDGSRPPANADEYNWIIRHCRLAGMDEEHTKIFFAKHRPWGWNAIKKGVNVCDLIADYVTIWKNRAPEEFAYIQSQFAEEKRRAEIEKQRAIVEAENKATFGNI